MSKQDFKAAWWLFNPHLQTIWPVLIRKFKKLSVERERLELPDGDFLDLDWMGKDQSGPLVMILHGLEGSTESHYVKGMLNAINACGWRGVVMHFRGCSGEPNRLPRSYHSGETKDLEYVISVLMEREQETPLASIGYSLGGNVLLKWLGETKANNPLKAAIAVSVPFELHKAASRIECGFSRFYQWYFLRCLRERLSAKFTKVPTDVDVNFLNQLQTMREFDDKYTAPLHGFCNVDHYYQVASSRQYLRHIQIPTLIVHAKDDPFMTEDIIPQPEELSSCIELEITNEGGHVGFVSGTYPWKPQYWLEDRVTQYLKDYFK